MFLGTYHHKLDAKGRLSLPRKFRTYLTTERELVITKGMDNCLFLFPRREWEQIREQLRQLKLGSRDARRARRLLLGNAEEVVMDRMGRILIPPALREYAGIQQEVVVVGLDWYMELWSPEAWAQELDEAEASGLAEEQWERLGI
ncbi:MAG: division/cell wall cluster transcriptional repressor MraZ [Chloroflexi bacterium]|nr:division/cell wall cluster transcriptional repressor MraZ [Chloroflexota bacterium]